VKSAEKLAKYQRQMARRKPERGDKPPAGYQRARRKAAKAHATVAAQRQDTARKWAKTVVRDHDVIAVEDFKPTFLAKSAMARKAADAAIGAAKRDARPGGSEPGWCRSRKTRRPAGAAGSVSHESPQCPTRSGNPHPSGWGAVK
jgi:putative transposase